MDSRIAVTQIYTMAFSQDDHSPDVSNDARQYIDPSRQDDNRTGASGTLPTLESWPLGKRDTVVGAPLLAARNCYMILPEIYTSSFWSCSRPHDPVIDAEEID